MFCSEKARNPERSDLPHLSKTVARSTMSTGMMRSQRLPQKGTQLHASAKRVEAIINRPNARRLLEDDMEWKITRLQEGGSRNRGCGSVLPLRVIPEQK